MLVLKQWIANINQHWAAITLFTQHELSVALAGRLDGDTQCNGTNVTRNQVDTRQNAAVLLRRAQTGTLLSPARLHLINRETCSSPQCPTFPSKGISEHLLWSCPAFEAVRERSLRSLGAQDLRDYETGLTLLYRPWTNRCSEILAVFYGVHPGIRGAWPILCRKDDRAN